MATIQSAFPNFNSNILESLPVKERPLGRLYNAGALNLSSVELLAVIIGGPQQIEAAQKVVQTHHDLVNVLTEEFESVPGIGKARAARLVAAIELGRRLATQTAEQRPQIRSPRDAADIFIPWIGRQERENFAIIYLNTRNQIIDREILYQGSLNTSLVRTAEVFRGAIRRNCAAIMVAHNHPSGDPSPSREDLALTRRLVKAGSLMEIEVLDHLVVAANRYLSFKERHSSLFSTES